MDKSNIHICSKLASEAYENELQSIPDSQLLINKATDCEAHIGILGNTLYIASRGTSSLKDAVQDLKMWRSRCEFLKNTNIHRGFLNQYLSIRTKLHKEIENRIDINIKCIIFTGHSLGAAISTIAALDFKLQNSDRIVKCITFASPRVGCQQFAKEFNKHVDISHRLVYHRDPVTFSPFCLRFRHVKGCIHFKKDKSIEHDDKYFFPLGCLVSQHFMHNYEDRVSDWVHNEEAD